ncbi:MAG: family 43 glycosylhydrolase [Bacteroidales bacterium]|nr:family 43 glycosylhydrolase [Bacteroidales bacterium]
MKKKHSSMHSAAIRSLLITFAGIFPGAASRSFHYTGAFLGSAIRSLPIRRPRLKPNSAARFTLNSAAKFLLLSATILSLQAIYAPQASAQNPLIRHIYTADPAALVVGDSVYLYTGHDEASPSGNRYVMDDWHVFSSADMVHWKDHGEVLKISTFSWAAANAWASHTVERNGKYYWYVTVSPKASVGGAFAIGVAVADHPAGPYSDVLGTALITDNMTSDIAYDIDPAVFIDDDGQAYLYWGNGTACKVVKLKDNMIELDGGFVDITPPNFTEAAYLHKHNGTYYFTYAANWPETIEYATGNHPMGPFTYRGLLNARTSSSTNHQSVIKFRDQWYFIYHTADLTGGGNFRRSVAAEYLFYKDDNTIDEIVQTPYGVAHADSTAVCPPARVVPRLQVNDGEVFTARSIRLTAGDAIALLPEVAVEDTGGDAAAGKSGGEGGGEGAAEAGGGSATAGKNSSATGGEGAAAGKSAAAVEDEGTVEEESTDEGKSAAAAGGEETVEEESTVAGKSAAAGGGEGAGSWHWEKASDYGTVISAEGELHLSEVSAGDTDTYLAVYTSTCGTRSYTSYSLKVHYGLPENVVSGNSYVIESVASGEVISIENGGTANGTNVITAHARDIPSQRFVLTLEDDLYWKITPEHVPGRALDVFNISVDNGANIVIWDYWGGHGQQWQLAEVSPGIYNIISRNSQKCLDVDLTSKNVIQWECHGSANQQFRLESPLPAPAATAADQVSIFPNPALDGRFSIRSGGEHLIDEVQVYNTAGRVLNEAKNIDSTTYQSGFALDPGLYIARIKTTRSVVTKTLLISN